MPLLIGIVALTAWLLATVEVAWMVPPLVQVSDWLLTVPAPIV